MDVLCVWRFIRGVYSAMSIAGNVGGRIVAVAR